LEGSAPVIHPETCFLKEGVDIKEIIPNHYSSQANRMVGDVVADFMIQKWADAERKNK